MPELVDTNSPIAPSAPGKKYGGRNEILARSGKLAELEVDVDGVTYVVRELSGLERAHVIGIQASARLQKKIDVERFTRQLLLYGVCDPTSPEGAREPAFTEADMDSVMRSGAGFLEKLTDPIEQLSGLGVDASKDAEDFSGDTLSVSSTSASPQS